MWGIELFYFQNGFVEHFTYYELFERPPTARFPCLNTLLYKVIGSDGNNILIFLNFNRRWIVRIGSSEQNIDITDLKTRTS